MSEPRWNDAGTRPLPHDTQGTYATQRTRNLRTPAGYELPPSAERSPRWGGLPAGRGVVIVTATTGLGTAITMLTGRDPGFVLGFCLVIGAIAASLAVRPGAVYKIIPAPALAYLVAAIIAGLIHDGGADTSRTALAISGAQWVASGFLAMAAATVLVILIGAIRWGLLWRRYGAISGPNAFVARSAASLRSTGTLRSTGSPRSAGGLGSTASPRGAGNPRSTGSPRSTSSPRSAGSPRSTSSPRSAGGRRGAGSPGSSARPPNAGGTGSRRPRSGPPGPGY